MNPPPTSLPTTSLWVIPMHQPQASCTLWTVAHPAPLSMGFPRQECWRELPYPPGDLLHPEIEPVSAALTGGFFTTEPPEKPIYKQPSSLDYLPYVRHTLVEE